MKNGVVVYADPSFGYGKAKDVYGHQASARWNPRICISGHAYVRRFYSDRRVKGPMIRKGFKAWVDAGFPRDPQTGKSPAQYFEGRGKEEFVRVSLEEAFAYVARTLLDKRKSAKIERFGLFRQIFVAASRLQPATRCSRRSPCRSCGRGDPPGSSA